MLWAVANIKMEIMKDGLLYGCDCIIMPLLAAEIPAKLSSSQLSRSTADVTVALEAIGEHLFTNAVRFKATASIVAGIYVNQA